MDENRLTKKILIMIILWLVVKAGAHMLKLF